jgi:hypothetical protein
MHTERRLSKMRTVLTFGGLVAGVLALAVSVALADPGTHVVGAGLRTGTAPAFIAVNAHGTNVDFTATGTARITTDVWEATISVTCIRPVGDLVVVGGLVDETTAPAGPGWGAVIVIKDGSAATRDQVGFGFEPPPPTTSTNCSVDPTIFPLAVLEHGNFSIK